MPIYEYTCRDCRAEFARLQKIGADSTGVVCPNCGSKSVARKVSTFSGGSNPAGGSSETHRSHSCSGFT